MHYTTKLGFGALVTVGAVAAFYSTQSRRRTLTTTTAPTTKALPIDGEDVDVGGIAAGGAIKSPDAASATRSRSASASSTQTENQKEAALDTQWQKFTDRLSALNTSILSTISLGNVLPDWSIGLPVWITKLQRELNMEPGSLADTIWTEARDPLVNPEVARDAKVRLSAELCDEEKEFLKKRREHTKKALAKYLEIPEEEIHPDDVPVIASTGSGGGLRAMGAGAGYYQALHESGLYDCITYTAGVSGSCWLQSIFLSSIGQQDFGKVIEHLKTRIGVHIAYPPAVLDLIDTVPTNKYLLRGIVEKLRVGYSQFGLVDLYGLLLGARLLVPEDPQRIDDRDLKLSQQKRFFENGEQPLPIYTAVRHEIPEVGNETENKESGKNEEAAEAKQKEKEAQEDTTPKQSDWFQWFEATPYEFYSEDLEGTSYPVFPPPILR
jgi:phospholipase A2